MDKPILTVVDDFFGDPMAVRALALAQTYHESAYHKGRRTNEQFLEALDVGVFERLLNRKITRWREHGMNGRFQICVSGEQLVYHSDLQSHAATVFLTPNAPLEAGLSLYRSKVTGLRRPPADQALEKMMYEGNLLDPTKWEVVDRVANIFNRLVLWDGRLVHAPSCYFGNSLENGRLFQIFFFDAE